MKQFFGYFLDEMEEYFTKTKFQRILLALALGATALAIYTDLAKSMLLNR